MRPAPAQSPCRRRECFACAVLAVAAVLAASPAAAEEAARRMTLSEVVAYGLAHSPDLALSGKGVDSARARLRSSKARRLPSLQVDANATYWDKEIQFDVGLPGMGPTPGLEPITVRERLTTSTSGTAVLPLVDQIRIGSLVAIDRHGLEASEQDHAARRLDVAAGAASSYLSVLLARATSDIAASRARLVSAQLDRARVLQQGGVLGRVDVMRLEAALAAAQRDAITSASNAASAEDALAVAIGLPEGTRVVTVDDLPDSPAAPPLDPAQAVAAATQRRPELRAARARAKQAHSGASAEKAGLLPSVAAVGSAQHTTGMGTFQAENAWFVGLNLSWTVWDWLSTWNSYRAADHQADRADLAASRLGDQLRLDVRRRAREARAAYDSLAVARAGLTAAEEAFRIQEVRFAEGATTTTELLSAETEVAEARIGYATARHAYYLQLAALAQATGQLPDALLPTTGAR
jgi:outer membrane protein TolC